MQRLDLISGFLRNWLEKQVEPVHLIIAVALEKWAKMGSLRVTGGVTNVRNHLLYISVERSKEIKKLINRWMDG